MVIEFRSINISVVDAAFDALIQNETNFLGTVSNNTQDAIIAKASVDNLKSNRRKIGKLVSFLWKAAYLNMSNVPGESLASPVNLQQDAQPELDLIVNEICLGEDGQSFYVTAVEVEQSELINRQKLKEGLENSRTSLREGPLKKLAEEFKNWDEQDQQNFVNDLLVEMRKIGGVETLQISDAHIQDLKNIDLEEFANDPSKTNTCVGKSKLIEKMLQAAQLQFIIDENGQIISDADYGRLKASCCVSDFEIELHKQGFYKLGIELEKQNTKRAEPGATYNPNANNAFLDALQNNSSQSLFGTVSDRSVSLSSRRQPPTPSPRSSLTSSRGATRLNDVEVDSLP